MKRTIDEIDETASPMAQADAFLQSMTLQTEKAKFSEEDPKFAEGMSMVKKWSRADNVIVRALVLEALYSPVVFRRVPDWQKELYTTLTNTIWIQTASNRDTIFTMREASGLVAFLDSMIDGEKQQDYMDGTYCTAPLVDEIASENKMHNLLRTLGFRVMPFYDYEEYKIRKAHDQQCTSGPPDDYSPREERPMEPFWFEAVKLWFGSETV